MIDNDTLLDLQLTTWCALFKEETRICMLRANFGPRMGQVLLPAIAELSAPQDIVIMNFGLWSNNLEELDMHTEVFESSFRYFRGRLPNMTYWRETSAQHYSTPSGEAQFKEHHYYLNPAVCQRPADGSTTEPRGKKAQLKSGF